MKKSLTHEDTHVVSLRPEGGMDRGLQANTQAEEGAGAAPTSPLHTGSDLVHGSQVEHESVEP